LTERKKQIPSHRKRHTLTITSPLGGEDEGEGEGNTKTALAYGKRWMKEREVKSDG